MALTASEYLGTVVPGFVTDSSGNLVLTTEPAAEVFGTVIPGFLTDADGRLVATYTPAEEVRTVVPGFVTDADGRLAIATEVSSPVYTQTPGFLTNADGYLSVQETPTSGTFVTGFIRDTDGALGVGATYLASPYEEAVMALTPSIFLPLDATNGLTDLSGNSRNGTAAGGVTVGSYTPGPLTSGDDGATNFDGTDDRITTTYATRRNLLTNPNFETNTTGWAASGSGATISRVTTEYQDGTASMEIIHDGVAADRGATTSVITTAVSLAYTASVYIKAPVGAALNLRLSEYQSDGTTLVGNTDQAYTGTGAWERVSVSRTFGALGARCFIVIQNTVAEARTWYVDSVLLEQASSAGTYFPTVAQLASGEAGWSGTANASGSSIGCFAAGTTRTIMGWAYRDATADNDVLFSTVTADSSARSWLRVTAAGTLEWSWGNSATVVTGATLPTGQWNHWAFVRNYSGDNMKWYLNGVEQFSGDSGIPSADVLVAWTGFQLGVRAATADPFNGRMAWVSVHQTELTAPQILAAYTEGTT